MNFYSCLVERKRRICTHFPIKYRFYYYNKWRFDDQVERNANDVRFQYA